MFPWLPLTHRAQPRVGVEPLTRILPALLSFFVLSGPLSTSSIVVATYLILF